MRSIICPAFGRNSRRPTITGTSRDANVSETNDYSCVFPSDEAYCAQRRPNARPFSQCRIVDNQPSVATANHPVGFGEQAFSTGAASHTPLR